MNGVQIGDTNVYTGGGITSIGNIEVSKKTPNNINYIPYDNINPQTEILQNDGIIPYKIDTVKPRIESVTITNDKTTLKLLGINNIIYIRINLGIDFPSNDDRPELLKNKSIKIAKNTEDPKLKLNLVHNQKHRYASYEAELSKLSENFLIFSYTIQSGDDTVSFNYNSANAFERDSDKFVISDQIGNILTDYSLPSDSFIDIKNLGITINTTLPDNNFLDEAFPVQISGIVTLNLDFTTLDDDKKNLIVTDLAKELDVDKSLIINVTYERGSTVVSFKVNSHNLPADKINALKTVNLKNKIIAGSTVTSSSVSETDPVKPFTDISLEVVANLNNYTCWIIPSDVVIVQNMAFQQNNGETWTKSVQGKPTTIKSPKRAGIYKFYIVNQYGNISTKSADTTITVLPPGNQNDVLNSDTIKPHLSKYKKNQQVTIVSSGDVNNEIWLAPSGQINSNQFTQGNNMTKATKANNENSLQILSPQDEGNYYLYVIDEYNNVSPSSSFYITVDNTPPNQPIVSWPSKSIKNDIVYTNQTKFDITNSNQADIYQLKLKIGNNIKQEAQTNFFTITENREYQIGEIEVFFIDEAGNESIYTKNLQKIIIDTVAPPSLLFDATVLET